MKDNNKTPRELFAKLAADIERKKIQYYEDTIHHIKTQLRTINTNKEKVKFLKDLLRNKVNGNEEFELYTRKHLLEKEPEIGIEIINSLFNSPDKIDKVNEYIKREIEYFSSIEDKKENTEKKLPKKTDFYKATLENQKQIALLGYYLRQQKIILPNISNTLLSECFANMNGYSPSQMIKLFDGAKDASEVSNSLKDYQNLIFELKKLTEQIEKEMQQYKTDKVLTK